MFRANKRRKVYRKREPDGPSNESALYPVEAVAGQEEGSSQVSEQEAAAVVKRPNVKKHGIKFAASGKQASTERDLVSSTAMVPFERATDAANAHERFMKPSTGKTDVGEDKHLMAYVDSKLAETRSSASTPLQAQDRNQDRDEVSSLEQQPTSTHETMNNNVPSSIGAIPSHQRHQSHSRVRKSRRGPHVQDASGIARASMVDQIFSESQVTMYDQTSSSPRRTANDPGVDNDEAAAAAFKADFLMELEQRQRRKPPAPPPPVKGAPPAPTGPKLGGSRSQRQKMKAMEEAKAETKK